MLYSPPEGKTNACIYETETRDENVLIYRHLPIEEFLRYYRNDFRVKFKGDTPRLMIRTTPNEAEAIKFIQSCFRCCR